MDTKLGKYPFDDAPPKGVRIFLICYLFLHYFLVPLAVSLLFPSLSFDRESLLLYNFIFGAFGALLCFLVCFRHLRRSFDRLCSRLLPCLFTVFTAYFIMFILGILASMALAALGFGDNYNNDTISLLITEGYGLTAALVIFLGPVLEELLFRAGVFASLRPRHKFLAYAASILLFGVIHVWSYALSDPRYLLMILAYLPQGFALCWAYDRTGTIWTPIFLHILYNLLAFSSL